MNENDINDEFIQFLGKIVRIDNENHKLPIYGRLTSISDQFLTLERRDGHQTLIKKKTILLIEPTRNQGTEEA
jgi:hypothetical protein